MTSPLKRVWQKLGRLEKVFVFLSLLEFISRSTQKMASGSFPVQGLIRFSFFILASILLIKYFLILTRQFVWRIRNRLIVAYIFIGVVPVFLIIAMVTVGLYVLMGQVATYLLTSELQNRNKLVHHTASILAWQTAEQLDEAHKTQSANQRLLQLRRRVPDFQAIIKIDDAIVPVQGNGESENFPQWSSPGFMGLVKVDEAYVLAAHSNAKTGNHSVEVFAFEPLGPEMLSNLLPGLATINLLELKTIPETESEHQESQEQPSEGSESKPSGKHPNYVVSMKGQRFSPTQRASTAVLPAAGSWWDVEVRWGTLVPYRMWGNGEANNEQLVLRVDSRPSLIMGRLFSVLGPLSSTLFLILCVIGGLLLLVEILSLGFGISLTKTITRSVSDLYKGTLRINSGDFSHRIAIRSNDQLSELATSFNRMTDSVQKLILESKEKERLESELEIAREVQSQLFPREVPRLERLELAGSCHPARAVSGDYYDFVRFNSHWTALAIGDVAGKGISAALLMASIQSSLRVQLSSRKSSPESAGGEALPLATSELTRMLNQQLYESTSAEKYVTFFCALVNDHTGQLCYTNAGHLPPLLIRNQQAHKLDINGMVLGAFPHQSYEQGSLDLQGGDLLVAYTDGITEPENEYGEEFGEQRLAEILVKCSQKPFPEIIQAITAAVADWSDAPEQQDDMTLLLLRRD